MRTEFGAGKIERFEDLVAWPKARLPVSEVYRVTLDGLFARDFGPKDQIHRAACRSCRILRKALSVPHGWNFISFSGIAKALCAKVRSQLHVAPNAGYLTQEQFDCLNKQAEELARIIGGFRVAVKKPKAKVGNE